MIRVRFSVGLQNGIQQLTDDPRFMQGVRSVMIGLGALFDEVYPAQTGTSQ